MQRRHFLQTLGAALGLGIAPLIRPARALAQPRSDGLLYSDSEGAADLTALGDGKAASGITYAA